MKSYEGVFIFHGNLDDETLGKQIEAIRAPVVNLGGRVMSATRMGKNVFARRLKKKESGIYVLMVFEMEPGGIKQLTERYKFNADILRVHIVTARGPELKPSGEKQPAAGENP